MRVYNEQVLHFMVATVFQTLYTSPVMQEKQKLTYIQGIKGVAIFLIVLFHLLPAVCPNGYMGVDIFFIISGYFLIGKHIMSGPDFQLMPFLKQKSQRLLLPYFALLLVVAIASVCIFPAAEILNVCNIFRASLLCHTNTYLASLSGSYFSAESRVFPLMHLWYMGVLLQCYALFSLLFYIWHLFHFRQTVRRTILVVLGVLSAAVAFSYLIPFPYAYTNSTYYWTTARVWEFALGGLLYPVSLRLPDIVSRMGTVISLIILISCSMITLPNSALGIGIGSVCGVLLILCGKEEHASRLLSCKLFMPAGNISFSLYLVHWPCICFAEYMLGHQLNCYEAAALCCIIVPSAYIFYRCIEKPRFPFLLLPILAVVAAGAHKSITLTHGFEHYLHQEVNKIVSPDEHACELPKLHPSSPLFNGSSGIRPNQFSPQAPPDILLNDLGDTKQEISFFIIGDSHAKDLARAMHLSGMIHGWHGIFLNSYVTPFWGAELRTPEYIAPGNFFDEDKAIHVISWLKQHQEIKNVFIAQYWSSRLHPHQTWDGGRVDKDIIQARAEELRLFCQQVKDCGKNIILVTDCPEIPTDTPQRILSGYLMWRQGEPVPQEICCCRADYEKRNGAFNREMDKLEQDGLCRVFHRERVFYSTPNFSAFDGKKLTHRDSHHLFDCGGIFSLSEYIEEIRQILEAERAS